MIDSLGGRSVSNPISCALDLGSSSVKVMLGSVDSGDCLHVLYAGCVPSRGVFQGAIADLDAAMASVEAAAVAARRATGERIEDVAISYNGPDARSVVGRAVIGFGRETRLESHHLSELADLARKELSEEETPVGPAAVDYTIDGVPGISHPLGMSVHQVGAVFRFVTASASMVRILIGAFSDIGLNVRSVTAHAQASAIGILSSEERQRGSCAVDIGAGSTHLCAYRSGDCCGVFGVPVGGRAVTNDISLGLRIPSASAERLKVDIGSLGLSDNAGEIGEEVAEADPSVLSGLGPAELDLSMAPGIVRARIEEIAEIVRDELQRRRLLQLLPDGVMLTGGGSGMHGIEDVFAATLGSKVERRTPVSVLADDGIEAGQYSCVAGLIRMSQIPVLRKTRRGTLAARVRGVLRGFF